GNAAPLFTIVKIWPAEFKRGRKSIFDEERSGRSKTATADETTDYVHRIVMDDRRLALKKITKAVGIS
ncbi:hypothetical protein EAI_07471, partial [Harpegnathos saltator]